MVNVSTATAMWQMQNTVVRHITYHSRSPSPDKAKHTPPRGCCRPAAPARDRLDSATRDEPASPFPAVPRVSSSCILRWMRAACDRYKGASGSVGLAWKHIARAIMWPSELCAGCAQPMALCTASMQCCRHATTVAFGVQQPSGLWRSSPLEVLSQGPSSLRGQCKSTKA